MTLYRKDILKILNFTLENFIKVASRQGKKYACAERVNFIHDELCDNKESYFGTDHLALEIDYKHLKDHIRKMLVKTAPEEIKISIKSSGDSNISSHSVDMNDSLMSVDSDTDFDYQSDPLFKLPKKFLIAQLKQANQKINEQKKELDSLKPLGDFFRCQQIRGAYTYGTAVDRLAVSLLCQGESSRGIVNFFKAFAAECPVLLISNNPDVKKRLPKKSYINSLRDIVPEVLESHLDDFIDKNEKQDEKFVLTGDQTTISNNTGILGMGLVDSTGNYHAIGLTESRAGTAVEINSAMQNLVSQTGFSERILKSTVGLMTDKCAAQVLANSMFIQKMNDEHGIHITELACFMHCTSNMEKHFCTKIEIEFPNVKAALHKTKLIFGSRKGMGYQRNSLKYLLADIIGGNKTTYFLSDKGSRYGVSFANSRGLIIYKSKVLLSLQNCRNNNSNALDLKKIIEKDWNELCLACACITMFWIYVVNPFHAKTSKRATVRETIETIQLTRERFEKLRDSCVPFEELLKFGLEDHVNSDSENAVVISKTIWEEAPLVLKSRVNSVLHAASSAAFWKFQKDTSSFNEEILPRAALYIFNNRAQEAAFGTLKKGDKRYLNMIRERLSDIAMSQINKSAEWLQSLPLEDSDALLKAAKAKRKIRAAKRRAQSVNSRNERLKKLRFDPVSSESEDSDE